MQIELLWYLKVKMSSWTSKVKIHNQVQNRFSLKTSVLYLNFFKIFLGPKFSNLLILFILIEYIWKKGRESQQEPKGSVVVWKKMTSKQSGALRRCGLVGGTLSLGRELWGLFCSSFSQCAWILLPVAFWSDGASPMSASILSCSLPWW